MHHPHYGVLASEEEGLRNSESSLEADSSNPAVIRKVAMVYLVETDGVDVRIEEAEFEADSERDCEEVWHLPLFSTAT